MHSFWIKHSGNKKMPQREVEQRTQTAWMTFTKPVFAKSTVFFKSYFHSDLFFNNASKVSLQKNMMQELLNFDV